MAYIFHSIFLIFHCNPHFEYHVPIKEEKFHVLRALEWMLERDENESLHFHLTFEDFFF